MKIDDNIRANCSRYSNVIITVISTADSNIISVCLPTITTHSVVYIVTMDDATTSYRPDTSQIPARNIRYILFSYIMPVIVKAAKQSGTLVHRSRMLSELQDCASLHDISHIENK